MDKPDPSSTGSYFDRIEEAKRRQAEQETNLRARQQSVGTSFLLQWIIASIIGGSLGDLLLTVSGIAAIQSFWIGFTLYGIMVAIPQWFTLRSRVDNPFTWIAATTGGWSLGIFMTFFLGVFTGPTLIFFQLPSALLVLLSLVLFIFLGTIIGAAQWMFVLRNRFNGAGWWILISIASFPIPLSFAVTGLQSGIWGAVHGLWAGAITGGVLLWLLHHPQKE